MSFVLDLVTFIISTHHKPLRSCLLFSHFYLTEQTVMHSVRAPTSKATLINMGHNNTISPHHQAGVKAWKPYNKSERLVLLNHVNFFLNVIKKNKKHQQYPCEGWYSIHMLFKRFSANCFMTILMKVMSQPPPTHTHTHSACWRTQFIFCSLAWHVTLLSQKWGFQSWPDELCGEGFHNSRSTGHPWPQLAKNSSYMMHSYIQSCSTPASFTIITELTTFHTHTYCTHALYTHSKF